MNVAAGEWIVTPDERAKHDAQFMQLNPANGFLTGDAARGFFLKSGLPPMVLGQIWELSDINKDGKLDAREFSIAMYFIKSKLQGRDLPSTLPDSLKRDPAPNGNTNQIVPAMMASPPASYGTLPLRPAAVPQMSFASAFDGFNVVSGPSSFSNILPRAQPSMYGPVPTNAPITSSYAALPIRPAVPTPTYGTVQTSSLASPVVTSLPYGTVGALSGGIPPQQWSKYTQLMTQYDVQKKGFLTGSEARNVLMQSSLATNLLAQIWNLSDADCDGNLNLNEFCVAMYLTEIARTGQPLPAQLPPAMLVAPVIPPVSTFASTPLALSLGQTTMPSTVPLDSAALKAAAEEEAKSFEDRRQENFKKGEAELERRRQMLQEQLKAEEDARLAAERAEADKREQQRLEAERKRQEELQRQLERQQQLERERQEQRNKAIEQREAARLQLERQRQAEWERQRREQLNQEKQREKNQLELRRSRITDLKFETNSIQSKQTELAEKVTRLKENIAMVTAAIDAMKQTRDMKVQAIEGMKSSYIEANSEYSKVHAEREQLRARYHQMTLGDPISDEMNQLRQQLSQRQTVLDKLRSELDQLADSTSSRQQSLVAARMRLEDVRQSVQAAEEGNEMARQAVSERRARYRSKKPAASLPKQQSLQNGWENSGTAGLSTALGSLSITAKSPSVVPFAAAKSPSVVPFAAAKSPSVDPFASVQSSTATTVDKWDAFFPGANSPTNSKQNEPVVTNDTAKNGWPSSGKNTNTTPYTNGHGTNSFNSNSPFGFKTPANVPPTPKSTRYRVIYNFSARNEDELNLHEGDVINVPADQSGAEPGWVYGEINDRYGMVPENYIQRLTDGETDAFSPSVLPTATQPAPTDFGASFPNSTPLQQTAKPPQQPNVAANDLCVALYNYESPESGDLNFNQGDVIHVLTNEGEWWTGQLNGRQGMFPATFVKPLDAESDAAPPSFSPPALDSAITTTATTTTTNNNTDAQASSFGEDAEVGAVMSPASSSSQPTKPASLLPSSQGTATERLRAELEIKLAMTNQAPPKSGKQNGGKKPEIVTVIAEYRATGAEQLTLEPGNLIYIKKKSDSGWWQGELHARGKPRQVGWFPANYVRPWTGGPGGSRQSSRTTPVSDIEAEREKVITMYPYTANHDDELTFKKDEIINVINKDDPDWWRGELNSVVGVFPSNYVKPIIQSSLQPKPFDKYYDYAEDQPLSEDQQDSATLSEGHHVMTEEPIGNYPQSPVYNSPVIESPITSGDYSDVVDDLERRERRRQAAIDEFIKTEEDYVQYLHTALEVFEKPLVAGGAFTPEVRQKIFVNWEELIACHALLLKPLRVRRQMVGEGPLSSIADIISSALPNFTPYIRYCAAHQNALAVLQRVSETEKKFKLIHQACMRDSRSGGLPLSSFLLKPVQRITKYHLLVNKILSYTPQDHFDFEDLQEAHTKAVQLCEQVNQGLEQRENSQRLEWIQNHVDVSVPGLNEKLTFNSMTNCVGQRRLLFYGSLAKAKSPSKPLWCFLFNDILLITKVVRGGLTDSLLFADDPRVNDVRLRVDKQPFLIDTISAKAVEGSGGSSGNTESLTDFVISMKDGNGVFRTIYEFRGRTAVDRNNWVKNINEAVGQYLPKQAQSRFKRSMSLYKTNAIGRLQLNIVGAKELSFARPPKGKPDAFVGANLGEQEYRTKVINGTCSPEWNEPAQFMLKNTEEDVLCVNVYDRDLFSPNAFLGGTEIRIKDLLIEHESMARGSSSQKFSIFKSRTRQQPLVKRLPLLQAPGQKSVIILKLDVQLFTENIPCSPGAVKRDSKSSDDSLIGARYVQHNGGPQGGRVTSGLGRRMTQIHEEETLKRRALSTVALDDWDN